MNDLKKWLVSLDMTPADYFLIKNTANLAEVFTPDEIHFVHVASKPDIPKEILSDVPELQLPSLISTESTIREKVHQHFSKEIVNVHVVQGNATSEILKMSNNLNIDLAILNRDTSSNSLSQKLTRKAPCSVLLSPSEMGRPLKSILTLTDFSSHAAKALETSKTIAEAYKESKVHVLHAYPDSSKYLNQSFETVYEVDRMLSKKNVIDKKLGEVARMQLNSWVEDSAADFEPDTHTCSFNQKDDITSSIDNWVESKGVDLIVVGSKGQSSALGVLIGSVSEKVYTGHPDKFVLVVKPKGENKSLMKAFFGI